MKSKTGNAIVHFLDQISKFESEIEQSFIEECGRESGEFFYMVADSIIDFILYLTIKRTNEDGFTKNEKVFFYQLLNILEPYTILLKY
jgi:hypothetical protein